MVYDKNLYLRDGSTDLTGDETGAWVDLGAGQKALLTFDLYVPEVSSGDVLDVKIEFSKDGVNVDHSIVFPQISAVPSPQPINVSHRGDCQYVRGVFDVTGTDNDFGAVKLLITIGGIHTDF